MDTINKIENKSFFLVKRTFDLLVSLLIFVITLPIVFLFCCLIRIESRGRAIYRQDRVGKNGKTIRIRKLRSMYVDAEKNGPQWAEEKDDRITKTGKFIRKTRIDELPQLINVIVGEMSLIGPRPERQVFIDEFSKDIPNFCDRLQVLPGLSGYAQVNGGYEVSPKEKFDLDMYYINNMSLKMDVIIVFKTVKVVFTGSGAR